jgi:uncharacterized protein (TIGR00730 family)
MRISVFCSANDNISKEYFRKTEELGKWIAKNGHSIVFGGCDMGLMECIAKSVHDAGGQTIGVVPRIIEKRAHTSQYVDVEIPCDDLNDRKEYMFAKSEIAIALPGGIGTLDEVFSVVASATIGYHSKRVIIYNMCGFWSKLIELLDDLKAKGFMRGDYHKYIKIANSLEDVIKYIDE